MTEHPETGVSIPLWALRDQPEVDFSRLLPYRGPHRHDHLRSVRFGKRMYLWEDPGTGVLRLIPDPEGQARWDRAQAAARRIWSPR